MNVRPANLFFWIALAIAPACSSSGDGTGTPAAVGTLSVAITTPEETAYTNGVVHLGVTVSGGSADTVELHKDDGSVIASLQAPYVFDWDTRDEAENIYKVTAVATLGAAQVESSPRLVVVDRTAPKLATRIPAAGAANVTITTPITAAFSEPIRLESVTDKAVSLEVNSSSIAKSLMLSPDGTKLTIKPTVPVGASSTLTATLTSALTDLAGNALAPSSDAWMWTVEALPRAPSGVIAGACIVTSFAGSGVEAFADGTGDGASFNIGPPGIAVGPSGDVYVGDSKRIRKVTPAGVVTTFAGSGVGGNADGTGAAATLYGPAGLAFDAAGNIYAADGHNIRKVTPAGVVTTVAGSGAPGFVNGTGTAASFNAPQDIAVDAAGNAFVADTGNNCIRKVTPAGVVTTFAGSGTAAFADGTGTGASFNQPAGVAVDTAGNVYVVDTYNQRIRKVTAAGVVTTLAGSGANAFAEGTGPAASFDYPSKVAVDAAGNVYVADVYNDRIRKVTPTGVVTTFAGSGDYLHFTDGACAAAAINNNVIGVTLDAAGHVFVSSDQRIRKVITVGTGELAVAWVAPPPTLGSPITTYLATASASGQSTKSCTSSGGVTCTISGLTSGVVYSVSVASGSAAGSSATTAAIPATPN